MAEVWQRRAAKLINDLGVWLGCQRAACCAAPPPLRRCSAQAACHVCHLAGPLEPSLELGQK